jgi:hypothetical protein
MVFAAAYASRTELLFRGYLIRIVRRALRQSGTYTVVSSPKAATSLVKVQGALVRLGNGATEFAISSAVPVDSSGNSLAGESETQLEAYFASYDQISMGTNRSNPLTVNEPAYYSTTFINALDQEVGPGIAQALAAEKINWNSLPVGAFVTVVFSDGTKALYIKTNGQITDHWAWAGVAWDKHGNRINRAGQPQSNPNTSGTGGGAVTAPGFGASGGRYNWYLLGGDQCT